MEMASIKAHKDSNTLIIMKNSSYTKPIVHRVNLMVGLNATCMEGVSIDGDLQLGKAARITGDVKANNVVLGPGSLITGDLTVRGDLIALDKAKVTGRVSCAGAATIRPGVTFGSLAAGGLIELQGKAPCRYVSGKMVVIEQQPEKTAEKESSKAKPVKKESQKFVPPEDIHKDVHPRPQAEHTSGHKKMGDDQEKPKKRKWLPW